MSNINVNYKEENRRLINFWIERERANPVSSILKPIILRKTNLPWRIWKNYTCEKNLKIQAKLFTGRKKFGLLMYPSTLLNKEMFLDLYFSCLPKSYMEWFFPQVYLIEIWRQQVIRIQELIETKKCALCKTKYTPKNQRLLFLWGILVVIK